MAGIIDIRFDYKTRIWTAKPRFAYDAESYRNGAVSAQAKTPDQAVYALADKMPEDIKRQLLIACPERIYRSPEYEWMDDKCIEVDGHCPWRGEWAERRRKYLLDKEINKALARA